MKTDFHAKIQGKGERVENWRAVFGDSWIPIQSPIPKWAALPGIPAALVYEIKIDELDEETRQRLVENLAGRFNLDPAEVDAELDTSGCPILASDVTVSIQNPQRWF